MNLSLYTNKSNFKGQVTNCYVFTLFLKSYLKGNVLLSFTHPQVVLNLYDFLLQNTK